METLSYQGHCGYARKYPLFFRHLLLLLFIPACWKPVALFAQGDLPDKWAFAGNVILASNIRVMIKASYIKDGGSGEVAFKMENISHDGSEVHFTFTLSNGKSWNFDLTPSNGKSEVFYSTGLKSATTIVSQANAELSRSHFSNVTVDGSPLSMYTEAGNYMARFTRPSTTTSLNPNALQVNCDGWQQRINEMEEFKPLPTWYKLRIGMSATFEQCKTQLAACQKKLASAKTQQEKSDANTSADFWDESTPAAVKTTGSATAAGKTTTTQATTTSTSTNTEATSGQSSGASGESLRQNTNPAITEMVARQNRLNVLKAETAAKNKQIEQQNYDRMIAFEQNRRAEMQQTTDAINGVTNALITMLQQNQEAKRQRQEQQERQMELRAQQQEAARQKELARENNIQLRQALFTEFKPKEIPLSSSPEKSNQLFYFIYSYDSSNIRQDNITVFISNVFEIGRYADGTWPFRNTINTETKTLTPYNEIMHGYYYSHGDAEKMRQSFREMLQANNGVTIKEITYKGKPAAIASGKVADFWDTGKSNPVSNGKTTESQPGTNKTAATKQATKPVPAKKKADFWDESPKPAKKDSAAKKKSDFWD